MGIQIVAWVFYGKNDPNSSFEKLDGYRLSNEYAIISPFIVALGLFIICPLRFKSLQIIIGTSFVHYIPLGTQVSNLAHGPRLFDSPCIFLFGSVKHVKTLIYFI